MFEVAQYPLSQLTVEKVYVDIGSRFERLYKKWKAGEITAVAAQRELGLGARSF